MNDFKQFSQDDDALFINNSEMDDDLLQLLLEEVISQQDTPAKTTDSINNDDINNDDAFVFEDVFEKILAAINPKSKVIYRKRMLQYLAFCNEKNVDKSTIETLNCYVHYLRNNLSYSASTVWTVFSIISTWFDATLGIKVLSASPVLKRILKNWSKDDKIKKSKAFTLDDINKYLTNAPDNAEHLVRKVALIFAVYGLLRNNELTELSFDNIILKENVITTTIRKSKGDNRLTSFSITDVSSILLVNKYVDLFKADARVGRFFRKLSFKMIPQQVMGINTIAKIAGKIAEYLQKPDYLEYTSHGFKRTGATLLANAGISLPLLKVAGNWKSNTVAEGYIAESDTTKRKIGEMMGINTDKHTSCSSNGGKQLEQAKKSLCSYNITAGDNAVFNFGENTNINK